MGKVGILAPLPAEIVTHRLPDHEVVSINDVGDPVEVCRAADVVISDYSGTHRVQGGLVDVLRDQCRLVQVPAAGYDSVDLDECAAAGIPVSACVGLNGVTVAEWCVWGALSALRGTSYGDRRLREGGWEQLGRARFELEGKVVGLVGLGEINTAAAPRFRAFDVDLRYWTRNRRPPEVEESLGVTFEDLDDLIRASDVLVLAIALSEQTRHLLDAERIASMKNTAVVVNAARGEIVDEEALAAALLAGELHGAAVDVYSTEPAPADHPLVQCDTAATTPHIAGTSVESVGRIMERVFDNLTRALEGREPLGLLDL